MRTTVVPAQITTIEDKIAGNLNVTQVLLLMTPVFIGIGLYGLIPPLMNIAWYKTILTIFSALISVTLAMRIKEKLVLDWLIVYMRYTNRPAFYIYNKNDYASRVINIPNPATVEPKDREVSQKTGIKNINSPISMGDTLQFEQLIRSDTFTLKFKPIMKGGLYVAIEQI